MHPSVAGSTKKAVSRVCDVHEAPDPQGGNSDGTSALMITIQRPSLGCADLRGPDKASETVSEISNVVISCAYQYHVGR